MVSFQHGYDISADSIDNREKIFVRGYGDYSFRINDVTVHDSIICFPKRFLIWKCSAFEDVTIPSLISFEMIKPTIEILFLGCGDRSRKRLDASITDYFRKKGIVIEQMSTGSAASTFNVLNAEGRNVAAALLTCKPNLRREADIKLL